MNAKERFYSGLAKETIGKSEEGRSDCKDADCECDKGG